jgi:hypothetical protein
LWGIGLAQDYGPNGWHASVWNGPAFNGKFMTVTSGDQHLQLHSGFPAALSSITSFSSTVWVYKGTVGTFLHALGLRKPLGI